MILKVSKRLLKVRNYFHILHPFEDGTSLLSPHQSALFLNWVNVKICTVFFNCQLTTGPENDVVSHFGFTQYNRLHTVTYLSNVTQNTSLFFFS